MLFIFELRDGCAVKVQNVDGESFVILADLARNSSIYLKGDSDQCSSLVSKLKPLVPDVGSTKYEDRFAGKLEAITRISSN